MRKLFTSRKFWLAIVGLTVLLGNHFGHWGITDEMVATIVTFILGAIAAFMPQDVMVAWKGRQPK